MKYFKILLIIMAINLMFYSCNLLDPTEVNNPEITEDKLLEDATGGSAPLITGLKYSFSDALMKTVVFTEVTSDNYDNVYTYLSNIIDNPRDILPSETVLDDTREIYFELQTIHAKALFGLNVILPKDKNVTNEDYATVYFYKGMALLMLSENFAAFPIEENGTMVKSEDALKIAVDNLKESLTLDNSSDNSSKCNLALARAYRLLGDKTNAALYAEAALAINPQYVFAAEYDAANLDNEVNTFTVARANSNDMQPLPRLDFLDPKFVDEVSPISSLKTEEAYLILAEVALANGDISRAQTEMDNAIILAKSREIILFTDNDPRDERPNADDFLVKYDNQSTPVANLIKKRDGSSIQISQISNTSVTESDVNSTSNSTELFRLLYLLRQEIFFSEGRRMSDLGIRLPVMQTQIDANPNINAGDYGTYVIVPSYIPAGYGLDEFTIDETNKIVTISYDMNKILAQNISSVSPLL